MSDLVPSDGTREERVDIFKGEGMKTQPSFTVRVLPACASGMEALLLHWKEYLMESTELCVLMLAICFSGTLIYNKASPLSTLSSIGKSFLMGFFVAGVTFLIIRSPFGRRSGAHFNPALTITYFFLGRVHRWDTGFYILSQFAGAIVGVFMAHEVLGKHLAAPPVRYVITLPGTYGIAIAFAAEFLLGGLVMGVVLFTTNRKRLVSSTPVFVALMTIFYYVFCSSLSGFSVNPARSFSSALFAAVWNGIWIYFTGPSLGMITAAFIYVQASGGHRVYCAKVFHDLESPCPFHCEFMNLIRQEESS